MLIKAWKPSINREGVCFGQPPIQQVRVETGGWVQLLDSVTPGLLPSHHLVYDGVGWPAAFVAPGLSPSHFGSSGTLLRYSSRVCLNSSRLFVFRFLTLLGKQFHNHGPLIWKLCCLSFCTLALPFNFGIRQIQPLFSPTNKKCVICIFVCVYKINF